MFRQIQLNLLVVAVAVCVAGVVVMSPHLITAAITLGGLASSLRVHRVEDKLPLKIQGLFEDNYSYNEFKERMAEDPEFSQALRYIYSLSSQDYMAFSRLVIEARYHHDQSVLRIQSNQFNKE